MSKPEKFNQEMRERAIRLVYETQKEGLSETAAIASVAKKLGCHDETLRRWIKKANPTSASSPATEVPSERQQILDLQREVRQLRQANEILRKASAFFAQAELDRPFLS